MNGRSPAFQFYPNDWLSSPKITLMSPAEEGGYIRLLCYDWANDGLPDNDEQLAALSRLGEAWFNGGGTRLRKCFPLRDGKLHNPRLDEERRKQELWREKSREGGKASAKARQERKSGHSKTGKGGSRVVQPKANSSSSSSPSSPSSSSPSEKEKPTASLSEHAFRLNELLTSLICARKPDFKRPDTQKSAVEIDRMIRLDHRTPERVEAVIRWTQADPFWRNNVLSTRKLREKFDQLELKMQEASSNGRTGQPRPERNRDFDSQTSGVGSTVET